jgi:hypothetical protein
MPLHPQQLTGHQIMMATREPDRFFRDEPTAVVHLLSCWECLRIVFEIKTLLQEQPNISTDQFAQLIDQLTSEEND